jgi:hypothetical protein
VACQFTDADGKGRFHALSVIFSYKNKLKKRQAKVRKIEVFIKSFCNVNGKSRHASNPVDKKMKTRI